MPAHTAPDSAHHNATLSGGTPRCLVFFQQLGFVSLELGYGRSKNVRNVLLKNTVNILLSAVCWWAVGYAFGYGDTAGGFIG